MKPERFDRDKFDHFRAEFHCPKCGRFLAHYSYGRAWTDNGLREEYRVGACPKCGIVLDWSEVAYPVKGADEE